MKRWLMVAALLTLVVSVFIFIQAMSEKPSFRLGVAGQWIWRYDHSPYADRAMLCFAAAALLGVLCHRTRERLYELHGGRLTTFLLLAVVLCFSLQASFAYLSRSGFGHGVFWMGTPKANVDFAEACRTNTVRDLLMEAQNADRPFRIHISTHPPGPTLFYLFQKRAWEMAPESATTFANMAENVLPYALESRREVEQGIFGRPLTEVELATLYSSILLLWLAIALGVVPLYFWAADLFGPPVAIPAVGLYALTPSFLIFNPMTDQLYVLFGIALLASYHLGLARRDQAQLIFAGVLTWVALQFSLAFLVVIFLIGLYLMLEILVERRPMEIVRWLAWPVAAFVAITLLCLALPYNCLVVWKLCIANNAHFNTGRTYWPWVAYNLLDFAIFAGLPVAVFFLRGIVHAIRRRRFDAPWRFIVVLVATVIILSLTGTNRGEVARLWMFLMPMTVAIAARFMHDESEETEGRNWGFLTCFGLMFVQSVLFTLSFDLLLPSLE
ncbi:MAG: hypothetical protein EXS18_04095 [Verrucomicrobiae bacterium]|nr:hypothetical protein [Verrucomicrobiae bacterium]